MPHDSLFREQERPAKAAVVIRLRHRSLAEGEPDAIRNLVASAVDGLAPEHVVLVDAAGNSPLGPKTAEAMQLSAEQALEDKLVATLEPVTGVGNVRASVMLDTMPRPPKRPTRIRSRKNRTLALRAHGADYWGADRRRRGSGHRLQCAQHAGGSRVLRMKPLRPSRAKTESGTYGVSKTCAPCRG